MKYIRLPFSLLYLMTFFILISCGSSDEVDVSDLPSESWSIQLDGVDFNVALKDVSAYNSSFTGDFTILGLKSSTTEERVVLTFSVEDGIPFQNEKILDLKSGSGNSILYFNAQGDTYSSHQLDGEGEFEVEQYIETDSRDFLSGSTNSILYNEQDSTMVTIVGSLAVKTF